MTSVFLSEKKLLDSKCWIFLFSFSLQFFKCHGHLFDSRYWLTQVYFTVFYILILIFNVSSNPIRNLCGLSYSLNYLLGKISPSQALFFESFIRKKVKLRWFELIFSRNIRNLEVLKKKLSWLFRWNFLAEK